MSTIITNNIEKIIWAAENQGVIIYPTDTVFALGGSIEFESTAKMICRIKNPRIGEETMEDYNKRMEIKEKQRAFSVAFSGMEQLRDYVDLDNKQHNFIKENSMKGTSFIVSKKRKNSALPEIPDYVTGMKETVSVRIPFHRSVERIAGKIGPIISTSANISKGRYSLYFIRNNVSLHDIPEPVREEIAPPSSFEMIFPGVLYSADAALIGRCYHKQESTIWDLTKEPYRIIRH